MPFTRAWRNFKRTEDLSVATASLIYAGAVAHAFDRLPGGRALIAQRTLEWPAICLALAVVIPLVARPLRRSLTGYVWLSFQAGFGQRPSSILAGLGLLASAALFIYWQITSAAHGGRYPAGVFSGYAAGIGILFVQAVLVRRLERMAEYRPLITEPDEPSGAGFG
jgi:hypothetical protein